jgi:hypothetical protein
MADDATTTTTPAADGRAYANENGTVDTGGRRAWVWCEDYDTGHRFDVLADRLPRYGARVVEGYPLHFAEHARDGKPRHVWHGDEAEHTDGAPELGPVADSPAPETHTSGDQETADKAIPVVEAGAPEGGNGDDDSAGRPAGAATKQKGRTPR